MKSLKNQIKASFHLIQRTLPPAGPLTRSMRMILPEQELVVKNSSRLLIRETTWVIPSSTLPFLLTSSFFAFCFFHRLNSFSIFTGVTAALHVVTPKTTWVAFNYIKLGCFDRLPGLTAKVVSFLLLLLLSYSIWTHFADVATWCFGMCIILTWDCCLGQRQKRQYLRGKVMSFSLH